MESKNHKQIIEYPCILDCKFTEQLLKCVNNLSENDINYSIYFNYPLLICISKRNGGVICGNNHIGINHNIDFSKASEFFDICEKDVVKEDKHSKYLRAFHSFVSSLTPDESLELVYAWRCGYTRALLDNEN